MAVAAESLKQENDQLDWEYIEARLAEESLGEILEGDTRARRPEAEIYGRSLSTVHRLGRLAAGKEVCSIIESPEAQQARAEFRTSVEEGFGTDMELGGVLKVHDFDRPPTKNGKVLAKDEVTPVSDMTKAGLKCAIVTASEDPRFYPQLTRTVWDDKNALITDDMEQKKTSYNTRIVPTLYTKEAAAKSGHEYWRNVGYVPHLERGFIQLYHAGENGFVTGSLSFDGSDIGRLREVFSKYGVHIPEDEITDNCLQYAITDTLSEAEAKQLAIDLADQLEDPKYKKNTSAVEVVNTVEITEDHKAIMDKVFDDSYVHICESHFAGRQTPATKELILQLANSAHSFNNHFKDALYKMRASEKFGDEEVAVLHEILVYSTIEMMRALYLQAIESDMLVNDYYDYPQLNIEHLQALDAESFQNTLGEVGAVGAQNNHTYSACGLAISLGGMEQGGGPQSAFGGLAETTGKRWMNCPFCPARVYDDPCAKILCCKECRAKVVNGKVVNKGNGGKAKVAAEKAKQKRRFEHEAELAQQVDKVYEEKAITAEIFDARKKVLAATGV